MTRHPGLRVALWTVAAVAAGAFAISAAAATRSHHFEDLFVYRRSVQAILHGRPLYAASAANPDPITYPPFAVLLMLPLAWVSDGVAQVLWTSATVALMLATCRVVAREMRWPETESLRWPLLSACVAVSAPFASNLRFGQISVLVIALAAWAVFGRADDRWSGVALGLSIAIKLTPAVFVISLVLAGRRKAAGWAVATFATCSALAVVALPSDSRAFWLHDLYGTSRYGHTWQHGNQSAMALLHRLGLDGGALTLGWLLIVGTAALVGYRGVARLLADDQRFAAIVVTGCLALVASPVAWTHHAFWLVLAAFIPLAGVHPRLQWIWFTLVVAIMTVPVPTDGWGAGAVAPLHYLADNVRGLLSIAVVLGFALVARRPNSAAISDRQS